MRTQITAVLVILFGCSSNNETDIPQNNSMPPANKAQDAQVSDVQTQDDINTDRDNETGGIGDTGSLDVPINTIDTTEESTKEEIQDANSEESEPDTNESIVDAGTDRAEAGKDASQNSNDSETPKDANYDASAETGSLNADGAITSEASVTDRTIANLRGCALQGRFACWPICEHPTFDVIVNDFIVKDRCTGLHWESHITANSTYYTFDNAARACQNKNLPIPTGVTAKWRMPTRLELASILDYGLGSPVLDTRIFAPSLDQFWTSSQTADTLSGWTLTMYQGSITTKTKTQNYYGRCVLDPLGDIYDDDTMWHFNQSTPGQFLDKGTLLTWESGDNQNTITRTFSSAQGYCQSGWRLPTLKELLTILDSEIVGAPGITVAVNNQVLPNAIAGYYWTDTTVYDSGMTSRHWALHFGTGLTSGTETSAYVRCVK